MTDNASTDSFLTRAFDPGASSLVEALLAQADARPDVAHLKLRRDDGEIERITFAELRDEALDVAGGLSARGVRPRDTVTLMLPTGRDFFVAFAGILLTGAVPVPIYPPVRIDQLEDYASRHVGILRNAVCKALITFHEAQPVARLLRPQLPSLDLVTRVDKLLSPRRRGLPAEVGPGDIGLIQYTSGSTGDPKGVTLTHANLLANIRAIGRGVEVTEDDVVVSWLPLYHDMGLIGCWLFAMVHGLPISVMSPLAFLRRPRRWLREIHEMRGTLTAAPNFAFELCLRRIPDRDLEGIDLSSWRAALNGAEPIQPETLERFIERFEPYGFRPSTFLPVYGLAENAVALTFPPLGRAPRIDRIDRETFQRQGKAKPASADDDVPLRFVAVGKALPGNEVRLVDTQGRLMSERAEGEIELRGESATPGYYRNPVATTELRTSDGWVRTGDLGYLAEGDLFITGRRKDLIIKGGRNIYPQEVEAAAAEVEGVRRGCVAAFSIPSARSEGERLVVVAETRQSDEETLDRLAHEVKRQVNAAVHVAPDIVEMVPPHTVPKTPSGKLRRHETRRLFLAGELEARQRSTWRQVARLGAQGMVSTVKRWVGHLRPAS